MAAANNNQGPSIILSTHSCDTTILPIPSSSHSQESEITAGASSGGIDSPCQKEQPQSDKHQEKINKCSQHERTSTSTSAAAAATTTTRTVVIGHNGNATAETTTTTSMEQANNNNSNSSNNNNNNSSSSNNNNNNSSSSSKSGLVVVGPRERLKRHRREVAGNVWIPEMWGQEDFLKDWIDCTAFDASLVPQNIMIARASLMEEARRATSPSLRLENSC